jgi:acyl-CoA reductase-like NAD-dependent aldehyde dehydrogenase
MEDSCIEQIVQAQHDFYQTGQTKDLSFRAKQLQHLLDALAQHETDILQALKSDMNKPALEAYSAEVSVLRSEIRYTLRHLRRWVAPRRSRVHLTQFPASGWVYPEPYGVTLIIAPWNYPLLLIFAPLVNAIAAGNCAMLKPSELSPATSALVTSLVKECFDPRYVTALEGGPEVAQALLEQQFEYIFYTGSTEIGKRVMHAAAEHLTPVTLELGGKSPCVVDAEVDVESAARRILWGKFSNAGQICIAPDYVLADRRIKPALIAAMCRYLREFYGPDPRRSPDYARIINQKHYERLRGLLPRSADEGTLIIGGQTDDAERYIAPTIIDNVPSDGQLMQQELFGPLLPVLGYEGLDEAVAFINARPKPLALYFFSTNRAHQDRILAQTSSGGGCINDTLLHLAAPYLPFGGVGASGMGQYRGKAGFDTFTHQKAFIKRGFWFETWIRYAPYKENLKWLRRLYKGVVD